MKESRPFGVFSIAIGVLIIVLSLLLRGDWILEIGGFAIGTAISSVGILLIVKSYSESICPICGSSMHPNRRACYCCAPMKPDRTRVTPSG